MNYSLKIFCTFLILNNVIKAQETECLIDGTCTNNGKISHGNQNLYSKGE